MNEQLIRKLLDQINGMQIRIAELTRELQEAVAPTPQEYQTMKESISEETGSEYGVEDFDVLLNVLKGRGNQDVDAYLDWFCDAAIEAAEALEAEAASTAAKDGDGQC